MCLADIARLRVWAGMLIISTYLFLPTSQALTYTISPGSDIVGQNYTLTLKRGDTLTRLASKYDVSYQKLIDANPGINPNRLMAGEQIIIPTRFILPEPALRQGIVLNLAEYRIYYFAPDGRTVHTFPVGIGRQGWRTPVTTTKVVERIKDPDWTAPQSIIRANLAKGKRIRTYIPPGPDNPLGAYALRLSRSGYLIHGTNVPSSVGKRVSHGCIRLYAPDIKALYHLVPKNTKVTIIHEPYRAGMHHGKMYFAVHDSHSEYRQVSTAQYQQAQAEAGRRFGTNANINSEQIKYLTNQSNGVVHRITPSKPNQQMRGL